VSAGFGKLLWCSSLAAAAAAWLACLGVGIHVELASGLNLLLVFAAAGLIYLRRTERSETISRFLDIFELHLLLALIAAAGAMGSYVAMAVSTGFSDPLLATVDEALGFDWLWLHGVASSSPVLMMAGRIAYFMFFPMPAIVIVGLVISGRGERAYALVAAYFVALLITDLVFVAFPAEAAFEHYLGSDVTLRPPNAQRFGEAIAQIRDGSLIAVDVRQLEGIITFPSFHTAAAALFIWASWPLRKLRPAMVAVNLAMIVSTTFVGGHYLVDILGGLVVAAAAVLLADRMAKTCARATSARRVIVEDSAGAPLTAD
jgi:membrane-associated phospholipid phosphatase